MVGVCGGGPPKGDARKGFSVTGLQPSFTLRAAEA